MAAYEIKDGVGIIPDSVTGIGGGAFSGCTGLTSIVIPDSVKEIGVRAFVFINEGQLLLNAVGCSLHKIAVYFLFVLILTSCLGTLMFIIEGGQPGSAFTDIGTSIYWAITTLSTVGYGDITPVTFMGRMLSGFIMLLGYTIIAVPTGIVSASFIDETRDPVRNGRCPRCDSKVRKGDKFCSHCGEKL